MVQPGTDQHEGRVAIRETTYHTGTASDLPVQPFNNIVYTDAGPVFAGEIAIGKRLLNAALHLLSRLFQFQSTQFFYHSFGLLSGCFLALLGVDRLEHLGYQLHLGERRNGEYIAVKVDGTPLIFGFGEYFVLIYLLKYTSTFIGIDYNFIFFLIEKCCHITVYAIKFQNHNITLRH